jgi:uncharacterized protein YbcV (DUF1398 family)
LVAAIRAAQADTVRYREFVKSSTAAGVIGYWVFLTGKRVIYFDRKGEQHIEDFPKSSGEQEWPSTRHWPRAKPLKQI